MYLNNKYIVLVVSSIKLNVTGYLTQLKKHRFVISAPGNGLDSHATWEALYSRCIPILPHSSIDSLFEDLPVWLVKSWEEITPENVATKLKKLTSPNIKYRWKKLFVPYWKETINDDVCV